MKDPMATLGAWIPGVGVLFLASLLSQGIARDNIARLQAQDSPGMADMLSMIFMQVMARPTLIMFIGFAGVLVILGGYLLNETKGWGRW